MLSRTHDLIGFASLVTIGTFFPPETITGYTLSACIVGNVVGSLIPDIDGAGNRLWDLLPAGNFVGKYARKIFFRHRTITHSILGGFLLYKGLWWILPKVFNPTFVDINLVFISIFIGYVAHLIADMLTREGIPLLFPFKWYFGFPPLSFLRMKTGGIIENFIVFPGVGIYIVLFLVKYKENIFSLFTFLRG